MPRSSGYEVRNLSTWDQVVAELSTYHKWWLFRGQANADWELSTSIEREAPTDRPLSTAERAYLHQFKRRAELYLKPGQVPETTGEWLALMQHYGAPTRLLDATQSPFVAAYFALEQPERSATHVAIWAIHRNRCLAAAGRLYLKIKGRRPTRAQVIAMAGRGAGPDGVNLISGAINAQLDTKDWLRQSVSSVVPYEPKTLSERLSVQQGAFIVPVNVDASFMQNLAALGDLRNVVIKFVVPVGVRPRALQQLRLMNITRASLFPGLDGFAQSFRQFLVEPEMIFDEPAVVPQTRERRRALGDVRR